jgi:hypothetical protein
MLARPGGSTMALTGDGHQQSRRLTHMVGKPVSAGGQRP